MAIYLKNIKFPVYPLSKRLHIYYDGQILWADTDLKSLILDDLSKPGNTLGIRRLHIDKKLLYPLKRSIRDLGSFLLYTKIYHTFLDSNGKLVKYKSRQKVPLIYRKVLNRKPYKNGTMVFIDKIHCPMWYYREVEKEYAALLCVERGYILLGFTNNPSKRTAFKI